MKEVNWATEAVSQTKQMADNQTEEQIDFFLC